MTAPMLSVIVCTYNHADLLSNCLQSLVQQSSPETQYEILVVDNRSADQTSAVVEHFAQRHANIRLAIEPRLGVSHARNRGLSQARAPYVAFIDDDAKAFPDWVERILQAFQTRWPPPVVIGGAALPQYEHQPPAWFNLTAEAGVDTPPAGFCQTHWACYAVHGMNMAFNKQTAIEFGGFDTRFGLLGAHLRMGEEPALIRRIYERQPYVWYDPAIRVQHWIPAHKMALGYQCGRIYQAGIAISRIEGTTLLSRRALAFMGRRLTHSIFRCPGQRQQHGKPLDVLAVTTRSTHTGRRQLFAALALRGAEKAGRLRGARWW